MLLRFGPLVVATQMRQSLVRLVVLERTVSIRQLVALVGRHTPQTTTAVVVAVVLVLAGLVGKYRVRMRLIMVIMVQYRHTLAALGQEGFHLVRAVVVVMVVLHLWLVGLGICRCLVPKLPVAVAVALVVSLIPIQRPCMQVVTVLLGE